MSPLGRRPAAALAALGLLVAGVVALSGILPDPRTFDPAAVEFRGQDQLRVSTNSAAESAGAHSLGQSFRADHANLSSIALQLAAYGGSPAGGRFTLYAGPGPDAPVAVSLPLTAADFSTNPYLTFHFTPLADSAGHAYYLRVDAPDPLATHLTVQMAGYDSYSAGAATLDGLAQPGDLAFRTFYRYTPADLLADLGRGVTGYALPALAWLAFLLLPGSLLARLLPGWSLGDRLLAAPALTLLAWPVLLLAGWTLGITGWGPWLVWAVSGAALLGHGALAWRTRRAPAGALSPDGAGSHSLAPAAPDGAGSPSPSPPVRGMGAVNTYIPARRRPGRVVVAGAPDAAPAAARATLPVRHVLSPEPEPAVAAPLRAPGPGVGLGVRADSRPATPAYWAALLSVLAITLASRLLTVRDLVAGMGLDAYHHTLVTALFLDRGGVPSDYAPYAPLELFTYHFGFHAFAAALGWLAPGALPVERLVLVAGQLAGTLPVLTLALFGSRVLGDRWLGLTAGALAGVVAIFPAFYVNWSRDTQGLGLALLPVAWVVLFETLVPRLRVRAAASDGAGARGARPGAAAGGPAVLAVIVASGLFLSHYRIAALFALYAALFLAVTLAAAWGRTPPAARRAALGTLVERGLLVTAGTALILLPWLLNLRANFTVRFAGSTSPDNAAYYDLHSMLGDVPLAFWSTAPLIALAAIGLGWAIWRQAWPAVALAAWLGLALLWSNPTAIALPGAGYVDAVTVATSSFIPVCLLAAIPLVALGRALLGGARTPAGRAALGTALATAACVLGLLAALRLLPILDVRPYVTPADLAGMTWLRTHTAPGALVLGNGFGWPWGPEAVQGSDAGVWTPVLAGRPSTVPPIPAYNERLADPAYLTRAADLVRASAAPAAPASWATLRAAGVAYLFAGSRGGVLDPATLLALPQEVTPVFHQDGVWIFALRPGS